MEDLDIPGATVALTTITRSALVTGDITYLRDSTGRRIAAVVPVEIAEHAERLRAQAEAIDV